MADRYYRANYDGRGIDPSKYYLELHLYTIATSQENNTTTERADLYMVVNNASEGWYDEIGDEAYVGIHRSRQNRATRSI